MIQCEILKEMEGAKRVREAAQGGFEIPNYLYVKHYGRNLEDKLSRIAACMGKQDWFRLRVGGSDRKEKPLQELLIQLEKNSPIGRSFDGCVYIEILENVLEREEEVRELLEYLKEQRETIYCIFSAENEESAARAECLLEQFFFVRRMNAMEYSAEEQSEIFRQTIQESGFYLSREAQEELMDYCEDREWKSTDQVEQKIKNMAKNLIYERMLYNSENAGELSKEVSEVHMRECLKKGPAQVTTNKRVIGFQMVMEG